MANSARNLLIGRMLIADMGAKAGIGTKSFVTIWTIDFVLTGKCGVIETQVLLLLLGSKR